MKSRDKIGLFGGSFDPIHTGHLILAQTALQYARLDRVFFIPTAFPPHKSSHVMSRFEDRVRMVELAIAGNEKFEISMLEKSDEVSFTWESVAWFAEKGYDREHLHLLVGGDSLLDMGSWRNPDVIFRNATIIAMPRPGYAPDMALPEGASVILISEGVNSISSTRIRALAASGGSLRYLVPPAVEEYIERHSLYIEGSEEETR